MIEIRSTPLFDIWLDRLKDVAGRARVLVRVARLAEGHAGDCRSVGEEVMEMEMRIHTGPGYRVYYTHRGDALIILLAGGDKGTQSRDIAKAKRLAREL